MNLHTYGHLIFDKGDENIEWKKDNLFIKWCWLNWHSACRRMKIDTFLSPCTKLKFKWIKNFSYKTKYTETIRREHAENLRTHRHRGKFHEQNNNGLCSKTKDQEMELNEIAKFLQG